MKKSILILLLSAAVGSISCLDLNAQPTEYYEYAKARKLYNDGNVMMWTGAGLLSSGIIYNIMCNHTHEYDPHIYQLLAGPMTALAGAATLIVGIPTYLIGRKRLQDDEILRISFGGTEERGFCGILEGSINIIYRPEIRVCGGYNFSEHLFAGIGTSYRLFFSPDICFLPVFANLRWTIGNGLYSPFIGIDFGYDLGHGKIYSGADFGLRIRNERTGQSFWLSTMVQASGRCNYIDLGIRAGLSF